MLQPCRLGSSDSGFDLRHVGAISLEVLEQMAVQVECHVDGRVAHDGLQALGRPAQILGE